MKWISSVLAVFVSISVALCETGELVTVVQIFRHGHRTPLFFSKNSPYKDPQYWDGVARGGLTELGRKQHRELGAFFRQRYKDFVPAKYDESDIVVKCSHSQRTYASARSFLEGLYPDSFEDVPLHKAGRSTLRAMMNCPKYFFAHMNLTANHDYFADAGRRSRDLYEVVFKNFGSRFPAMVQAYVVWDMLHLESQQGLVSEDWASPLFPWPLQYVARNFTMSVCGNEEMQRIGTGTFLDAIMEHFDASLRRPKEKVILYSGHDINLSCLLSTFDVFGYVEPDPPPFASSIIFELRRLGGKAFLNGYYKADEEVQPIRFRDCDFNCDYDRFKDMFKHIRLTEWEWVQECLSIF